MKNKGKPEKILRIVAYKTEDWRKWLEKNHLAKKKVGVIIYKKHTGKPSMSHRDAMNEAICFGWIDTTIKRLDENRFIRYFVKRGDKANWSENTLRYAKELLLAGRMAPAGIFRYKQGLQRKPHDFGLEKKPSMPVKLEKALAEKKKALKNFESFPPSIKYMFYRWILRAKREETKTRRIKIVVKRALENNKNPILS
jgi:uncharacterized protein YdeI (YjbR/CyaY-like superfamily)